MSRLSARQKSALAFVAKYHRLPPIEPSTWKSLIRRGLMTLDYVGNVALTREGEECL